MVKSLLLKKRTDKLDMTLILKPEAKFAFVLRLDLKIEFSDFDKREPGFSTKHF